jgi:4-hydroxybenzoyl-CoA thioesterase
MAFVFPQKVRFQHCDPAEIVFYPRYYEMLNATIEEWFETRLGQSFAEIHGPMGRGVPTVAQETRYHRPSRLGDRLDFTLTPVRLGGSSVTLAVEATCAGEPRVSFTTTLVWYAKADGRPRPWPDALRAAIQAEMQEGSAS